KAFETASDDVASLRTILSAWLGSPTPATDELALSAPSALSWSIPRPVSSRQPGQAPSGASAGISAPHLPHNLVAVVIVARYLETISFGAREATIFSKRGSPRSGSQ